METWIASRCRTTDVRRVAVASSIALVTLVILGCGRRYWTNFFGGPYPLEPADLDVDVDNVPRPFVHFTSERFEDSGIEEVSTSRRYGVKTSESHTPYWLTVFGEKFVLVKADAKPQGEVVGEIKSTPRDIRNLLGQADAGTFHASYIDTDSYRLSGWIGLAFAAAVLGGAGLVGYRASQRLTNPRTHATARRIAAWGDAAAISDQLEAEMERPITKKGGVTLTQTYVLNANFLSFDVFRWEDLLWAYLKVVKKSVNFIPTGKEHHLVLKFADGEVSYMAPESAVKAALKTAERRAPWAVFGHSDQIERMFDRDRANFVAAVEERKAEVRAQPQPPES